MTENESECGLREHYFFKRLTPDAKEQLKNLDNEDCLCVTPTTGFSLNPNKKENLVGYVRADDENDAAEKSASLKEYCEKNNYSLQQIYLDLGDKPSYEMTAALNDLEIADGIIATDINQFIAPSLDRMRDIRPFVHNFFCTGAKHLITVEDGIDTGTAQGQLAAMDLLSRVKDEV